MKRRGRKHERKRGGSVTRSGTRSVRGVAVEIDRMKRTVIMTVIDTAAPETVIAHENVDTTTGTHIVTGREKGIEIGEADPMQTICHPEQQRKSCQRKNTIA
jgi:hypothetical protein